MKQLYEYFYLEKNEIKKLQKNISPELLASKMNLPFNAGTECVWLEMVNI